MSGTSVFPQADKDPKIEPTNRAGQLLSFRWSLERLPSEPLLMNTNALENPAFGLTSTDTVERASPLDRFTVKIAGKLGIVYTFIRPCTRIRRSGQLAGI